MKTEHGFKVQTISGASGGISDIAEVNMRVIAPGYTVDGVARLTEAAPNLLAERDALKAVNAELVKVLEAIVADAGKTRMAHLDADLPQDRALIQARAALEKARHVS